MSNSTELGNVSDELITVVATQALTLIVAALHALYNYLVHRGDSKRRLVKQAEKAAESCHRSGSTRMRCNCCSTSGEHVVSRARREASIDQIKSVAAAATHI